MSDRAAFEAIVNSFREGFVRHHLYARATHLLRGAYAAFNDALEAGVRWPAAQKVTYFLGNMTREDYEVCQYMAPLTQLVYANTLLDTLLTDVTTFLLMRYPRTLGKTTMLSFDDVISADSTEQLISSVVAKKVREVGALGLSGRLDYLRNSFGLRVDIPSAVADEARESVRLRNRVVHDQALGTLKRAGAGVAFEIGSGRYPTPVSEEQLMSTSEAFSIIGYTVAESVARQVLKLSETSAEPEWLAAIEAAKQHGLASFTKREREKRRAVSGTKARRSRTRKR